MSNDMKRTLNGLRVILKVLNCASDNVRTKNMQLAWVKGAVGSLLDTNQRWEILEPKQLLDLLDS